MLDIEVLSPTKTDSLYEFTCHLEPRRSLADRLRGRGPQGARLESRDLQFGFRAMNFEIPHHEVWDGFYALFFLTRNGGPLYNKGFDEGRIHFRFPISAVARDFFIARAADLGLHVAVEAEISEARIDRPTEGDVLAFGGGKDSRLILGMLREFGVEPTVITSKGSSALDIPGALVTESLHGALVDRIMPSYMALGRRLYFGATIGDVHRETPWHQHYDLASPGPVAQMEQLLASLGAQTDIITPLPVLPYTIIQRMLHDRYPELYAHQVSTRPGSRAEKSLHIALLKLANGYSIDDQCTVPVFQQMLKKFVRHATSEPTDYGFRNRRLPVHMEMRAIIYRHRNDEVFEPVREQVPPSWESDWMDYIHPYVQPTFDPEWMAVYREYAPTIDEAGLDAKLWRVPI